MNKYVVKNCPNCWIHKLCRLTCKRDGFKDQTEIYKYCQDYPDCLIKQVITKCRERHVGYIDEAYTKDDILQLFEIEEV